MWDKTKKDTWYVQINSKRVGKMASIFKDHRVEIMGSYFHT